LKPLSYRLNAAIMERARGLVYDVSDHAPNTLDELARAPRLIVYAGASDRTIYGDPQVNWAFRAWHDNVHKATGLGFDLAGEVAVARIQCAAIPDARDRALLWADIVGQTLYFARFGIFPADQRGFVTEFALGDHPDMRAWRVIPQYTGQ
jgi:hypothetical protein